MTRSMSRLLRTAPIRMTGSASVRRWRLVAAVTVGATAMVGGPAVAGASTDSHSPSFRQVTLVSDVPGAAALTDPDLVNAWGLSASPGTDAAPGSPLWVSDNGADKTTLYVGTGPSSVTKAGLVVSIASGAPTGQVFNTDSDPNAFVIDDGAGHSGSAVFLFDSENGGI